MLIEYDDRPAGSRVVIEDAADALSISVPPPRIRSLIKPMVAAFVACILLTVLNYASRINSGTTLLTFMPWLRELGFTALLFVAASVAGWFVLGRGVQIVLTADSLTIRRYGRLRDRTREVSASAIGRVYPLSSDSALILDRSGKPLTKLGSTPGDAEWISKKINRRLDQIRGAVTGHSAGMPTRAKGKPVH